MSDITNQAPTPQQDSASVYEFGTIDSIDVLSNDSDPEGDNLTVISAIANSGSAFVNENNTINYTADSAGIDYITYTVQDIFGNTAESVVVIDVLGDSGGGGGDGGGGFNNAPVANDDYAITDEHSPVSINVIENDVDFDGDNLSLDPNSITVLSGDVYDISVDGNVITVMPSDLAGQQDIQVSYSVTDGIDSSTATLNVTVTPIGGGNTPPVVNSDNATTLINQSITVNVLQNDDDPDGDTIVLTDVSVDPNVGQVTVNEDATITFLPNYNFVGQANIQYSIQDSSGASASTSLFVNVQTGLLLEGTEGDDDFIATLGSDTIFGFSGDDFIIADDDSEYLEQDKDDILIGGTGNDFLIGGNGSDTYIFNLGDGQDTINNYDNTQQATGIQSYDTLLFGVGINPIDIQVSLTFDEQLHTQVMILSIVGTNDQISIMGWFDQDNLDIVDAMVDTIEFADGTIWTKEYVLSLLPPSSNTIVGDDADNLLIGTDGDDEIQGLAGDDILQGGTGDDILNGGMGDDILNGGMGDDTLQGGEGSDSYIFNVGAGHDVIDEYIGEWGDTNYLVFGEGINPDDLELRKNTTDNDLIITIKNSQDSLTIRNYFNQEMYPVNWLKFANNPNEINIHTLPLQLIGDDADNEIFGGFNNDIIFGMGGDDFIGGNFGDDFIDGGAGNDQIFSAEGKNTIVGGLGNDYLTGGQLATDTYIFNLGDGQDVIDTYDYVQHYHPNMTENLTIDTLKFGVGISADDIELTAVGDEGADLLIRIRGTEDSILVRGHFHYLLAAKIDVISFADGTVWDTELIANKINQPPVLFGGQAPLANAIEDNAYIIHDSDLLVGYIDADGDVLSVINLQADHGVLIKNDNGTHTFTPDANFNGRVNLSYQVSDGRGGVVNNTLNYLFVEAVNDAPMGGPTAVLVNAEQYLAYTLYASSLLAGFSDVENDNLSITNLHATNATIEDNGDGSFTVKTNTTGQLQLSYQVIDGNGGLIEATQSLFVTPRAIQFGTENDDVLGGDQYQDTIQGLAGNDYIFGNDGDDSLDGGSGHDTLDGGEGNDSLYGGDAAQQQEIIAYQDVIVGYQEVYIGEESVIVGYQDVYIGDEYVYVREDYVYVGDETVIVGYEDVIVGYESVYVRDDYVYIGDQDVIIGYQDVEIGQDEQGQPIYENQAIYETQPIYEWQPVYEDQPIYESQPVYSTQPVYGWQPVYELQAVYESQAIYETRPIYETQPVYESQAVYGLVLVGGNDNLYGGEGDDTLQGGAGSDYLAGGNGNDSYIFNLGDGQDIINNFDNGLGADRLVFGQGINAQDIEIQSSDYGDLIFAIKGTADSIRLMNYFYNVSTYQMDIVQFADGTTWTASQIEQFVINVVGDQNDNVLNGNILSNIIQGLEGNDDLRGHNGNDTLIGGLGNDSLEGGEGNDTYVFNVGDGQDVIYNQDYDSNSIDTLMFGAGIKATDIYLSYQDMQLRLNIAGTNDSISLAGYSYNFAKTDQITFADGTVWTTEDLEALTVTFRGTESADYVDGLFFNDMMYGQGGNDELRSGRGNDTLDGGTGHDWLEGEAGDDLLYGGDAWQETGVTGYQDVIVDYQYVFVGYEDVLIGYQEVLVGYIDVFVGYQDVYIGEELIIIGYEDVVIDYDIDGQPIFETRPIEVWQPVYETQPIYRQEEIYESQPIYNQQPVYENQPIYVQEPVYGLVTVGGDDSLYGGEGDDTLIGGQGNDYLDGSHGHDTYVFNLGDGQDTINNRTYYNEANSQDVLVFGQGINTTDIHLSREEDVYGIDLKVNIIGTTDSVTLSEHFDNGLYSVNQIKFADGTTWTYDDVIQRLHQAPILTGVQAILANGVEDQIYTLSTSDLLQGFTDINHDVLSINNLQATNGTLFSNQNGSYSFIADSNFNGVVNLSYQVIDENGDFVDAHLDLVIDSVNDAPILFDIPTTLANAVEDISYTLSATDLLKDFVDADGDELSVINLQATNGSLIDNQNGTYSFSAHANFHGTINISYQVSDGKGGVVNAVNSFVIDAVNDAPTINPNIVFEPKQIDENQLFSFTFSEDVFADIDGDQLTYMAMQANGDALPSWLSFDSATRTFMGTPSFNDAANLMLKVIASDGMLSTEQIFSLMVNNVNRLPTGSPTVVLANVDKGTQSYNVALNDLLQGFEDADGDLLTISNLTADHATVVNNNNGTYTLTLEANYDGVVSLNYQVSDGLGGSINAVQTFNVLANTTGTLGADILVGGVSDDTYIVNNTRDVVVETQNNGGIDTVQSSLSYNLGHNLENLVLVGTTNLSGVGNNLDNMLTGNDGNNRLLTGFGNDTLYGGIGSDTLNGGEGADVMKGGLGNDTFTIENANDLVVEFANEGYDSVNSFITYTLTTHVERLNLENAGGQIDGFGNDADNTLNGNNFANYLFGGAGNDTLQGKAGADTLEGGLGDDVYYVDNVGDVITELAGEGIDKVNSTVSYTLTANVEQLYLTGIAGLSGTGNAQNNIIYGNSGNNALNGSLGNDSLNGGAGNDTLEGGQGNDTLVGGLGNDTYRFGNSSGRDTIDNKDSVGNDVLLLAAGITAEQVWLRQLGNDLEVSIIGTNNSAKVKGWYGTDEASKIDSIQLSTGNTLLASEVQYLVEAMAAFTPPPLGQTTLNTQQQAAFGTTIAIVWETITGTA